MNKCRLFKCRFCLKIHFFSQDQILLRINVINLKPFYVCILLFVSFFVDGNFHIPLPSMNRLSQTELATFSILPCWAFFRDSAFLYLKQSDRLKPYIVLVPMFHPKINGNMSRLFFNLPETLSFQNKWQLCPSIFCSYVGNLADVTICLASLTLRCLILIIKFFLSKD
jgi:uncharacterized membrane protein YbaN (DUF454 family)